MLQRFQDHINTQLPFLNGKKLIIAISGGRDSVVLAHLTNRLHFNIVLAHCNFNLRGSESDKDEAFVIDFSKKLGVEVHIQHFDTQTYMATYHHSVQLATRTLRYQWFASLRTTLHYDYILTAHHADDNLETFLINLSRGTGIEGLTGIPEQNNCIVRPLLPFSGDDILTYAKKNRLTWREDSSNAETKYLRNKIRHEIVPQLKKLHPTFLSNFQKTLIYLKASKQVANQQLSIHKAAFFQKEGAAYKISIAKLTALTPQSYYLYELFKDFGFTQRDAVAHILQAPSGKQLLSATHRLVKDRAYIYITTIGAKEYDTPVLIQEHTRSITSPVSITIDEVDGITNTAGNIIYVDKEKLKFPLTVRKWKKGDYFYPFGMQGKKKLSKFFKDEKYSMIDKEAQWLLCANDIIIWVIGKRADDRYKVDHN
ncbi:MAG: tRNA lysidine(34) synthetase TilS, partial [Bacteroidota bacterium]